MSFLNGTTFDVTVSTEKMSSSSYADDNNNSSSSSSSEEEEEEEEVEEVDNDKTIWIRYVLFMHTYAFTRAHGKYIFFKQSQAVDGGGIEKSCTSIERKSKFTSFSKTKDAKVQSIDLFED